MVHDTTGEKPELPAFNQGMKDARKAKGYTLDDVVFILRRDFPLMGKVHASTISRMETGATTEKAADWLLVSILAQIYEVPTAQLSARADANRLDALRLLQSSRCNSEVPGQGRFDFEHAGVTFDEELVRLLERELADAA